MAWTPRTFDPKIRPGLNGNASAMVKGTLVCLKAAPTVPGTFDLPTGGTSIPYGVLMADCASGAMVDVQVRGVALCLGSAAISAGANVTSTNAGKSVTAAQHNKVWGIAVSDGEASVLHEVELAGSCGGSPTH